MQAWKWPCGKDSKSFEAQDEVPIVWYDLAWSACHENDFTPPQVAWDKCEALQEKIDDDAAKFYQDLIYKTNFQMDSKNHTHVLL